MSAACDHFTRVSLGGSKLPASSPVVGLLFGTNDGSVISVCDNTDVIIEKEGSTFRLSDSDIERRKRLWTTVYQNFQLIGWYSFGTSAGPAHLGFHRSVAAFAPNPIFLLFNSSPDKTDLETLPIQVYVSGSTDTVFQQLTFKIDSPEVEKLAIDEIIQSVPHGYESSLEAYSGSVVISLTALENKLSKIINHLSKMRTGEIEWDANFARNAAAVVQALERMNSTETQHKISSEVTDSFMSMYLGSATKSLASMQELQSLYSVLYSFERDALRK